MLFQATVSPHDPHGRQELNNASNTFSRRDFFYFVYPVLTQMAEDKFVPFFKNLSIDSPIQAVLRIPHMTQTDSTRAKCREGIACSSRVALDEVVLIGRSSSTN